MKILVISHTYIAPINRDKWKVLASQHKDVHIKVLIPARWPTHLFTHEAQNLDSDNTPNCQFIAIKEFNAGNEVLYGYQFKKLYALLKTFVPDIIHVEQGDNAFSYFQVILLTKLLRLKSKILFFTWVNWHAKFSWKYRATWRWIEKINLAASCGAIVGNNDAQKILLDKNFHKPILVLPQLGVNQQIFTPQKNSTNQLKYIGYIGRIVEEKGIQLLIEAFALLEKKFADWRLIIVGRGPYQQQIERLISGHNLTNKIIISPPVSHFEVANLINKLDILVLPSYDTPDWKEQFGHIIIEAMACAIPVIGSSAGEIPHVIQDAGIIFEQKKLHSLLASLTTLMQDEVLRRQLGERGLEHVSKNYSHQAIAQATYMFWQSLAP